MKIIATYSVYSITEKLPEGISVEEALDRWEEFAPVDIDPESAEIRTVHILDDEGAEIEELVI